MTTREYHQNVRIFDICLDFQLLNYDTRFAFWTLLNKMVHITCCILYEAYFDKIQAETFFLSAGIMVSLLYHLSEGIGAILMRFAVPIGRYDLKCLKTR